MNKFILGIKSILHRRQQFFPLVLVCAVGIALSLYCIFLVLGMLTSLVDKARIYYGGDYIFFGGYKELGMDNADEVVSELHNIFPAGTKISARLDYDAEFSSFFFEGTDARQRIVKGIDFDDEREMDLLMRFNYLDGNPNNMSGKNGILLSEPISRHLNVNVGDEIVFMLKTKEGYINTVNLLVHGIFVDSSLFGMYTSYVDIDVLRAAWGCGKNFANRICIDLPDNYNDEKLVPFFQKELEKHFNMFPQVDDKDIFYSKIRKFEKQTYLFVPMSTNLMELRILIDAMFIVAGFIIVMLLTIITIGVSSAYRVIVMKRINEIGIYMAMGMRRVDITRLFLVEAFLIMIVGSVSGLIVSAVLCRLTLSINLSFVPALDVFLTGGSLFPKFSFLAFAFVSVAVCVTTISAVLFSIRKSVGVSPAVALSTTE